MVWVVRMCIQHLSPAYCLNFSHGLIFALQCVLLLKEDWHGYTQNAHDQQVKIQKSILIGFDCSKVNFHISIFVQNENFCHITMFNTTLTHVNYTTLTRLLVGRFPLPFTFSNILQPAKYLDTFFWYRAVYILSHTVSMYKTKLWCTLFVPVYVNPGSTQPCPA